MGKEPEGPDVMLIDMPCLLRDILRDAVGAAGLSLTAEVESLPDALALLEAPAAESRPLAVLASAELIDAGEAALLHERRPLAAVLAVSADGRSARLYRAGAARATIADASPTALVARLRKAVG